MTKSPPPPSPSPPPSPPPPPHFIHQQEPSYFEFKKWSLIIVCTLFIIIEIVFASISAKITDDWMDKHAKNYLPPEWEDARRLSIIYTVTSSIIMIVIELIGIFGSLTENIFVIATFLALHLLGTIGSFAEALKIPILWIEFSASFLVIIIGLIFIRDLVFIRRQRSNQQYT